MHGGKDIYRTSAEDFISEKEHVVKNGWITVKATRNGENRGIIISTKTGWISP